jgi:hypothetical protein
MLSQTLATNQLRDLIRGLRPLLKQGDHKLRQALLPQPRMPDLSITHKRTEPIVKIRRDAEVDKPGARVIGRWAPLRGWGSEVAAGVCSNLGKGFLRLSQAGLRLACHT